ncbi:hypothetical protein HDF26_001459 [Pedobacter cryoconitis]|uniref:glycosyltransferase n=1 Tax=Pedobacter cryoconitis TaxID=188932 RepID=UPI00160BE5A8|nr:glycosyltransferase [Pedobacter cryoconitis]MBB6271032.1 hypothetical protein [Pedobacter cryoconitis]
MLKTLKKIARRLTNRPDKDYEVMPVTGETAFNWKHLGDQRLYTDNNYALQFLENNENPDSQIPVKEKIIYHAYWYGNIGRKQAFSIKSFLCTQDLTKCRVILWLDADNGYLYHEKNPILKAILPFIEVKAYDPYQEIKNTPWKNSQKLVNEPENLAKRSDAFRFLVLYKYGGLYFDLDVMFLKDFGGLLDSEFCYAWETQPYANSAILSLKKKSNLSAYILNKGIKKRTVLPWIILNYSDSYLKKLHVLPCAFFDPVWQGLASAKSPLDDFPDFFRKFDDQFTNRLGIESYKDFFPGCYAYHWHNQWKKTEYEDSLFGIFENDFNKHLNIESKSKKQELHAV